MNITPTGTNHAFELYINSIVQPILDTMIPRCDLGELQTSGYTKHDHENIMQCFVDFMKSSETWNDNSLMQNIMRVGRGKFNPAYMITIIGEVRKTIDPSLKG